MKKRILTTIVTIALCFCTTMNAFAGWFQEDGHWKYINDAKPNLPYKNLHTKIDGNMYYFDENGYMVTGWYQLKNGSWRYYGNDGALVKSSWIDDTYYVGFDGKMWTDSYTPDGFYVGSDGKYVPGKTNSSVTFPAEPGSPGSVHTDRAYADAGTSQAQTSGYTSESDQVLVEGNVSSVGRISAPLPDEIMGGFCYAVNSADGVKVRWKATNLTGKTVKYYSVGIAVKNPVGDYCIDQITKEDVKWLKYVGPVAPGEDFIVFDIVGYYGAPHEIIIPLIELEYMDGTKEMVEYLYSTTEQHQRIL